MTTSRPSAPLTLTDKGVYTSIVNAKRAPQPELRLPALPCACANLRRAARAVTRIYNRELRAADLELTQYTLLMALGITGESPQGKLGRILALDTTTLTRMLGSLVKRGWIEGRPGGDRRQRLLRLTPSGERKLKQARPFWERAQERLRRDLGESNWDQMTGLLVEIARVSTVR